MHFSSELIMAACISVAMAGPHHLHRHRDVHEKRAAGGKDADFFKSLDWQSFGIDWAKAYADGQKSAAVSSTSASAPAASPAPIIAMAKANSAPASAPATPSDAAKPNVQDAVNSIISDVSKDVKTAFSNIEGLANKLTAFGSSTSNKAKGAVVSYVGNIGSPQGSNMIKVSSPKGHQFTNTFENTSKKAMTIVLWNKAYTRTGDASDAEANLGSCLALTTPALSINLAPGGKQTVAFMENSQIGFSEAVKDVAISGAPATTWGEINFLSAGSGFDVSAIMNKYGNTYDMSMTATETQCISDKTQNNWIARNGNIEDPIPIGNSDGSCFISQNTATLTTKMGGQA